MRFTTFSTVVASPAPVATTVALGFPWPFRRRARVGRTYYLHPAKRPAYFLNPLSPALPAKKY